MRRNVLKHINITFVISCLAGGALVDAAVSLAPAAFPSYSWIPSTAYRARSAIGSESTCILRWESAPASFFSGLLNVQRDADLQEQAFDVSRTNKWLLSWHPELARWPLDAGESARPSIVFAMATGWPMRSRYGYCGYAMKIDSAGSLHFTLEPIGMLRQDILFSAFQISGSPPVAAHPSDIETLGTIWVTRPIWAGLVGNALGFGLLFAMITKGYLVVRRRRRMSRAECENCGYIVGDGTKVCSECGFEVPGTG